MNAAEYSQLQTIDAHQGELLMAYQEQHCALQATNVHLTQAMRSLPANQAGTTWILLRSLRVQQIDAKDS